MHQQEGAKGKVKPDFGPPQGDFYEVPFRSLVPVDCPNLLVASRAFSATHEAAALQLRFGAPVSVYAALVYLAAQLVRMATITCLLAVLLAHLLNLPVTWSAVLVAGFTGLYATKGGFEAVVWTEVLQTIVLMAGALGCVLVVLNAVPGGLAEVWSQAVAAGEISVRWQGVGRCKAGAPELDQ